MFEKHISMRQKRNCRELLYLLKLRFLYVCSNENGYDFNLFFSSSCGVTNARAGVKV